MAQRASRPSLAHVLEREHITHGTPPCQNSQVHSQIPPLMVNTLGCIQRALLGLTGARRRVRSFETHHRRKAPADKLRLPARLPTEEQISVNGGRRHERTKPHPQLFCSSCELWRVLAGASSCRFPAISRHGASVRPWSECCEASAGFCRSKVLSGRVSCEGAMARGGLGTRGIGGATETKDLYLSCELPWKLLGCHAA